LDAYAPPTITQNPRLSDLNIGCLEGVGLFALAVVFFSRATL
jgi:hypothetical protein